MGATLAESRLSSGEIRPSSVACVRETALGHKRATSQSMVRPRSATVERETPLSPCPPSKRRLSRRSASIAPAPRSVSLGGRSPIAAYTPRTAGIRRMACVQCACHVAVENDRRPPSCLELAFSCGRQRRCVTNGWRQFSPTTALISASRA